MLTKKITWRSKKYLKWVKTLPCCLCRGESIEAHHIKGAGGMSGAGLTAPDSMVMPVCRACHNRLHHEPALWPDQWEYIARTLERAISDGVLK